MTLCAGGCAFSDVIVVIILSLHFFFFALRLERMQVSSSQGFVSHLSRENCALDKSPYFCFARPISRTYGFPPARSSSSIFAVACCVQDTRNAEA